MAMKRKGKLAALMLLASALGYALTGCGGGGQTTSPDSGAAEGGGQTVKSAEALYKQNCVACHGDKLDGRGAANRNLQQVGSRYTPEELSHVITNGRGGGMPAFKARLSEQEIATLTEWLMQKR